MESELGVKIFDRKTKPVSVTRDGIEIIEQLKIIVKEINVLDYKIQELKGEMVGELRIGVIPTIAPFLLPLFLSEFVKKFPGVKISVEERTTSEIKKLLKNRSLDIGIASIPLEDNDFEEHTLYNESFLLFDCFNKSTNNKKANVANIDYSHLLLLEEGHCMSTQVKQICNITNKQNEHNVNFEFRAGSIDSLIRFTKAHKGITLLPYIATLDLPTRDKKHLRKFKSPVPMRAVGLVVHKHFVKKRLLDELQYLIISKIKTKLDEYKEGKLFKPV